VDGALRLERKIISVPLIVLCVLAIRMFLIVGAVPAPEYTLDNFPHPFVLEDGTVSGTIILIPTSEPHGPCGSAHTMDTMGGVSIAYALGRNAINGMVKTAMDTYGYISAYDPATAKVTMIDTTSNLIVLGGPGVNQVTYYYNELKNATGARVLPVLFLRDASGDYLYVQSSGEQYRIEKVNDQVTADYGVIQLHTDENRCVMLVYGLGGRGTFAAANVVAEFNQWNLTGTAVIVKYYDSNGDGNLDAIDIVERVPSEISNLIEVYWNSNCTERVVTIDWGAVGAGSSKDVVVYVKNTGNAPATLYLSTQNWSPSDAANYMRLNWDYGGEPVNVGAVIQVRLTLTVYANVTGIANFNFDVVMTGVD